MNEDGEPEPTAPRYAALQGKRIVAKHSAEAQDETRSTPAPLRSRIRTAPFKTSDFLDACASFDEKSHARLARGERLAESDNPGIGARNLKKLGDYLDPMVRAQLELRVAKKTRLSKAQESRNERARGSKSLRGIDCADVEREGAAYDAIAELLQQEVAAGFYDRTRAEDRLQQEARDATYDREHPEQSSTEHDGRSP